MENNRRNVMTSAEEAVMQDVQGVGSKLNMSSNRQVRI